jgi:hypothetical protein
MTEEMQAWFDAAQVPIARLTAIVVQRRDEGRHCLRVYMPPRVVPVIDGAYRGMLDRSLVWSDPLLRDTAVLVERSVTGKVLRRVAVELPVWPGEAPRPTPKPKRARKGGRRYR